MTQYTIKNYDSNYDEKLVSLFYRSLFVARNEFEYIRGTPRWSDRYSNDDSSVINIAFKDKQPIATLGALTYEGLCGDETCRIGTFLDNSLAPQEEQNRELVFGMLFDSLEKELQEKGISVLAGWDYLENSKRDSAFFQGRGYHPRKNVNWFPSSINFKKYPEAWNNTEPEWQDMLSEMSQQHNEIASALESIGGVSIRPMSAGDVSSVKDLYSFHSSEMELGHSPDSIQNIIHSDNYTTYVLLSDQKIIGASTFFSSSWGGWMFGRPLLDSQHWVFKGITSEQLTLKEGYRAGDEGKKLLFEMLRTNPQNHVVTNDYHFLADFFDKQLYWKENLYTGIGCVEPEFDYGVIYAKSLDGNTRPSKKKAWFIPPSHVVEPTPVTS